MKKKSKDQGYLIAANGGGEQHTGSGGDMDRVHRWVIRSDMARFLRERLRGNKGEERRGELPLNEASMQATVSPKEERKEREVGSSTRDEA